MESYQIVLLIVGLAFAAMALVFASFLLYASFRIPSKKDPKRIKRHNGFVKAFRSSLYDGEGNQLILRGINFGDWFVQEPWMSVSAIDGTFENAFGYTQRKAVDAFASNPNLSKEQVDELNRIYLDSFIQERDFAIIKELGLNAVRINFTCYNLTLDGYEINPKAFDKLDWAIGMAEKHGLYVILDNHGAIGSQNQDNHSGDDAHFELFGSKENEEATIRLWEFIAERYKDCKTVAIYDLLNEPRRAVGKFAGRKQFDFYDRLYHAVRNIDQNHVIMMECFTFPIHGVSPRKYGWYNVAYSYHIYNLTKLPMKTALWFYQALHNLLRYNVPVVIGEFSCWGNEKDWRTSFRFFDKLGWSRLSWTYKANRYFFADPRNQSFPYRLWGLYECDVKPVEIGKATYEEIKEAYLQTSTEHCSKTLIFDIYESMKP